MMYHLKQYHKKHGGFVTVIKLSEMLWKYTNINMVIEYRDGTTYTNLKRVRTPRSMHVYRLKSARGLFTVVPSRFHLTPYYMILTPRNTAHIVNRFHIPFATLYNFKGV